MIGSGQTASSCASYCSSGRCGANTSISVEERRRSMLAGVLRNLPVLHLCVQHASDHPRCLTPGFLWGASDRWPLWGYMNLGEHQLFRLTTSTDSAGLPEHELVNPHSLRNPIDLICLPVSSASTQAATESEPPLRNSLRSPKSSADGHTAGAKPR